MKSDYEQITVNQVKTTTSLVISSQHSLCSGFLQLRPVALSTRPGLQSAAGFDTRRTTAVQGRLRVSLRFPSLSVD